MGRECRAELSKAGRGALARASAARMREAINTASQFSGKLCEGGLRARLRWRFVHEPLDGVRLPLEQKVDHILIGVR